MTSTNSVKPPKTVAIVSGGLDSTTMLYHLIDKGYDVVQALSFNYGQRHKKELDFAQATCERLRVPWSLIDLWSSGLTDLLSSSESSLINPNTEVPHGHYAQDNMKATVVPNRNMIMLSIAVGVAVANSADTVSIGVHAGDHFVYPDCRPDFIDAFEQAAYLGNEGFGQFKGIDAPYILRSKADIATIALEHRVPLHETWSCYEGGDIHCGRCGTCVERLEAIHIAQERIADGPEVKSYDKTEYADTKFWQKQVQDA